jgi:hypothetical protein
MYGTYWWSGEKSRYDIDIGSFQVLDESRIMADI